MTPKCLRYRQYPCLTIAVSYLEESRLGKARVWQMASSLKEIFLASIRRKRDLRLKSFWIMIAYMLRLSHICISLWILSKVTLMLPSITRRIFECEWRIVPFNLYKYQSTYFMLLAKHFVSKSSSITNVLSVRLCVLSVLMLTFYVRADISGTKLMGISKSVVFMLHYTMSKI